MVNEQPVDPDVMEYLERQAKARKIQVANPGSGSGKKTLNHQGQAALYFSRMDMPWLKAHIADKLAGAATAANLTTGKLAGVELWEFFSAEKDALVEAYKHFLDLFREAIESRAIALDGGVSSAAAPQLSERDQLYALIGKAVMEGNKELQDQLQEQMNALTDKPTKATRKR